MRPGTKKLLILFLILVLLGGGLIFYVQKNKRKGNAKSDPTPKNSSQGSTEKPINRADRDKVMFVQQVINARLTNKPVLPIPTDGIWTSQTTDAGQIVFGRDISGMTYSEIMLLNQSYSEPVKQATAPKFGI